MLAQKAPAVRRYVEDTGLPFDVLVDEARAVAKDYGVWRRIGLDAWNMARPAVFFIDRERHIRWSFIADLQSQFPSRGEILAAIT